MGEKMKLSIGPDRGDGQRLQREMIAINGRQLATVHNFLSIASTPAWPLPVGFSSKAGSGSALAACHREL